MIEIGQKVTFHSGIVHETLTGIVESKEGNFLHLILEPTGKPWSVREDVVTAIDSGGVVKLVDTAP